MGQFGMQMPGGRVSRSATPDVYTGLMGLAMVALLAACVMMYIQGSKLGADGSAIGLQDPSHISLKTGK